MRLLRLFLPALSLTLCALPFFARADSGNGTLLTTAIPNERFDEDLLIRPLRDGRTLARFAFTTLLRGAAPRDPAMLDEEDERESKFYSPHMLMQRSQIMALVFSLFATVAQHYTLFPLTLGQILRAYGVAELDLTLNAGQWDYDAWGAPPEPGVGAGAELRAWMGEVRDARSVYFCFPLPLSNRQICELFVVPNYSSTIDDRWRGLRNALSGLFCASLASMDAGRTTSPTLTFPPSGALPRLPVGGAYHLRHARLPAEHVCTENLTPFAKLLPCARAAGLGQLLSAHKLFDADWHGVRVRVRWLRGEGVELRLAVLAVFDPVRTSGGKGRGQLGLAFLFLG